MTDMLNISPGCHYSCDHTRIYVRLTVNINNTVVFIGDGLSIVIKDKKRYPPSRLYDTPVLKEAKIIRANERIYISTGKQHEKKISSKCKDAKLMVRFTFLPRHTCQRWPNMSTEEEAINTLKIEHVDVEGHIESSKCMISCIVPCRHDLNLIYEKDNEVYTDEKGTVNVQ
ncbi:unnamed protein product [Didymodactylos carnosus]|uniref:Uncharacterized protein n=1 Tax=Didymodactylos carnosus TaxID=1234261 RepID=A0A815TZQ6_9BILA|nr:unnamed protein product [Didymodactylos carnosus]CAF4375280.1 unnamed protein product [Didymodactylos carnosus]